MRGGLIGAGAIALAVARAAATGTLGNFEVVVVANRRRTPIVDEIQRSAGCKFTMEPRMFLEEELDVVIEAAHPDVVRAYAVVFAQAGFHQILLSSGALLDPDVFRDLALAATEMGARVVIPSGAIGGLDVLRASTMLGGLERAIVSSIKPPVFWDTSPWVRDNGIDLSSIRTRTLIFSGSALDAVRAFPSQLNVAASVSLAGIGPDNTGVRVYADPGIHLVIHRLELAGTFGQMTVEMRMEPSPQKVHGALISALSTLETIRTFGDWLRIGN